MQIASTTFPIWGQVSPAFTNGEKNERAVPVRREAA
jgi:hypothetical protein